MVIFSHRCFRSKDISHHFINMTVTLFPWWFVSIFLSISKIWLIIIFVIGCKFRKILCIILSVSISIGCYVIWTWICIWTNVLCSCGYRCCLLISVYLLRRISFTLVINIIWRQGLACLILSSSTFSLRYCCNTMLRILIRL